MTLILNKSIIYADPYRTNRFYLTGLATLQMIPLEGIDWDRKYKVLRTSLWGIPWAFDNKKSTKVSMEHFISDLNYIIKEL